MSLYIKYSPDYFKTQRPDEMFSDESEYLSHLFNVGTEFSKKDFSTLRLAVHRGWMLSEIEYDEYLQFCEKNNLKPVTSKEDYYFAHHIDKWYESLKEFTPDTLFFKDVNDLKERMSQIKFDKFFIKDSVHSLTTTRGSAANNLDEIIEILSEMEKTKGIEGKIAVREFIDFEKDEERYFSVKGKVFSRDDNIPEIVKNIASKMKNMSFISIDIAKDLQGKEWLVEIGDGQVSDLKKWDVKKFAPVILSLHGII